MSENRPSKLRTYGGMLCLATAIILGMTMITAPEIWVYIIPNTYLTVTTGIMFLIVISTIAIITRGWFKRQIHEIDLADRDNPLLISLGCVASLVLCVGGGWWLGQILSAGITEGVQYAIAMIVVGALLGVIIGATLM